MWVRVDDEEMQSKVMKALSNPNLRSILISCSNESKAVSSLATELKLPLSSAYHHIEELSEAGLLTVDQIVITPEGKRYETYRSAAREVRTVIRSDRMVVELLPNEDVASRFYRLWSSVRKVK